MEEMCLLWLCTICKKVGSEITFEKFKYPKLQKLISHKTECPNFLSGLGPEVFHLYLDAEIFNIEDNDEFQRAVEDAINKEKFGYYFPEFDLGLYISDIIKHLKTEYHLNQTIPEKEQEND